MKQRIKALMPTSVWSGMRSFKHGSLRAVRALAERSGFIVTRAADYYGPTPSERTLRTKRDRWVKPSRLPGVAYDLQAMEALLAELCNAHLKPFAALPSYASMVSSGFGPGYPHVDAFILFCMMRESRPANYLEVGSGLSTAYAQAALESLGDRATAPRITCIEPYPYASLKTIPGISLIQSEVQDVPLETFEALQANDILFIDSSHIVRIDGDVPYLFLEVLPRLRPGVIVHVHDIPFPYNIPYPAEYWTLLETKSSPHWPIYWNEAMLLQALLVNNPRLRIHLSLPLLRFHNERCLRERIPFYQSVAEQPNTFSSLWLRTA